MVPCLLTKHRIFACLQMRSAGSRPCDVTLTDTKMRWERQSAGEQDDAVYFVPA